MLADGWRRVEPATRRACHVGAPAVRARTTLPRILHATCCNDVRATTPCRRCCTLRTRLLAPRARARPPRRGRRARTATPPSSSAAANSCFAAARRCPSTCACGEVRLHLWLHLWLHLQACACVLASCACAFIVVCVRLLRVGGSCADAAPPPAAALSRRRRHVAHAGTCCARVGDVASAAADLQALLALPVTDEVDGESYADLYALVVAEVVRAGLPGLALPFMDALAGARGGGGLCGWLGGCIAAALRGCCCCTVCCVHACRLLQRAFAAPNDPAPSCSAAAAAAMCCCSCARRAAGA